MSNLDIYLVKKIDTYVLKKIHSCLDSEKKIGDSLSIFFYQKYIYAKYDAKQGGSIRDRGGKTRTYKVDHVRASLFN